MLFKTFSAAVFGIDAYIVEVEVDIGPGSQGIFNVVGLPDNAVRESRERVRAALRNCGFDYPFMQTITVNLAPAGVRKERSSAFDLPIALGVLGCIGALFGKLLDSHIFLGELSLDGSVRPVRGALSAALAARERGIRNLVVPEANACEAAVVEGTRVFAIKSLPQAVDLMNAPESFELVTIVGMSHIPSGPATWIRLRKPEEHCVKSANCGAKLERTRLAAPEYEALMNKIRALVSDYRALIDARRKPEK